MILKQLNIGQKPLRVKMLDVQGVGGSNPSGSTKMVNFREADFLNPLFFFKNAKLFETNIQNSFNFHYI